MIHLRFTVDDASQYASRLLHLLLMLGMLLTVLPPPSIGAIASSAQAPRAVRAAQDGSISILDEGFSPPVLIVTAGDVVTWTNDGTVDHQIREGLPPGAGSFSIYLPFVGNQATHIGKIATYLPLVRNDGSVSRVSSPLPDPTATPAPRRAAASLWESGVLAPGVQFSLTFTQTGTFSYHDPLHPTSIGQIQVIPAEQLDPTPATPNQLPTIAITSPADGAVLASPVQVTGTVADDGAVADVTVNGVIANLNGNSFSAMVDLDAGNQLINAAVVDDRAASATASRVVAVDSEGPALTIQSPPHQRSVTAIQPTISVAYTDFYSPVDMASLTATLTGENGEVRDVRGDLSVTDSSAGGMLSMALAEGRTYTLTVSLADGLGNVTTAHSAFYVPAGAESIAVPAQPDDAGWVSAAVYDSATCDEHLTTCKGLAGATVTLARVDVAAVQQIRDQRDQASRQRWLRNRGTFTPLAPRALAVTTPVSGVVVTGPDGFFAFPVDKTGIYWLRVEKDGYTYAQREVELARNHHTATDALYLTPLDPALTVCDSDGCTHINSDGSMQVMIPAGAIAPGDSLDVTATVFEQVEFLPSGSLPEGTWETYAFNLGGDSDYQFQPGTEATVRIANSRGFSPGTPIPLGYWNPNTLTWEHAGLGMVDATGQWVEMTVTHFSNYDCNDPIVEPQFETEVVDQTDDNEVQECPEGENGCFVSLRRGTLGEAVELPTVQVMGENVAPTLLYNTDRVAPAAVIDLQFSLDFQENVNLGQTIGFELFVEGIRTDDFTFSADLQPGEVGRFRYLWDGRNAQSELLPPGLYAYTARFRVPYQAEYCFALDGIFGNPPDCENGGTGVFVIGEKIVGVEGTVDLNTQMESPYGAGWVLAGVQRLYRDDLGRILITDGDRTAEFYDPPLNAATLFSDRSVIDVEALEYWDVSGIQRTAYNPQSTTHNTYRRNAALTNTVVQGFITEDTTWDLAGSPYVITSTVVVNDNVTLTIEPGVAVQVNAQHGLIVLGALDAVGTMGDPITFDPVNAGDAWLGVQLGSGAIQGDSDGSELRHVVIDGAGLSVTDAYPSLSDLTIRNNPSGPGLSVVQIQVSGALMLARITSEGNNGSGLSLVGGDYVLNELTVRDNGNGTMGGSGVAVSSADSQVSLSNSTISGNLTAAILPAQALLTNNSFENNWAGVITWIGGVIDVDTTWAIPGITSYQIAGPVTVNAGRRLTIPPGTPISVAVPDGESAGLDVIGNLHAVGTPSQPITFTQIGGSLFTNSRIDLRGSGSHLAHVTIRGLVGTPAALNVYANTPTLDRLAILDSTNHGLYVEDGGNLAIRNSVFQGNGDHALFNATPAQPIDATNNYWGAQSGPLHPTLNPAGVGDRVSAGVLFDPWLTVPPGTGPDEPIASRSAADFSELSHAEAGGYVRYYPDGTTIHFNAGGLHTHTLTRVGTHIGYSYNEDGSVASMAITAAGDANPDWAWTFNYSNGRLTGITDPAGRTTAFTVNDNNHLAQILFPDATNRSFFYNQEGLMTQQVDQAGAVTAYAYDRFGRIRTVTEPARPTYDPVTGTVTVMSEVRTFTSSDTAYPLLNESAMGTPDAPAPAVPASAELVDQVAYGAGTRRGHTNKWGMWIDSTDGVGRTHRYQRDANNNLTRETLPSGDCVDYAYDSVGNRLSRTELPASECSVERSLDAPAQGRRWSFTFEERFNRIKTETDPNGNTTTYIYDYEEGVGDVGNLIRIEYPTVSDENGMATTPAVHYTYDERGQMLTETDPRGVVIQYIYTQGTADEANNGANPLFLPGVAPAPGLLTQVIEDTGGEDDLNVTTTFKGFDGAGNATIRIDPHGATYQYIYDVMNRRISVTDPLGVVTQTEYDPRGNPARMVEDFTDDPAEGLNVVTTFEYNLYTQLVRQQTVAEGRVRGVTQVYDVNRNLAQVIDVLGNATTYTYDAANQRTGMTDALGNGTTYTYDERGLLATVTHSDGSVDRTVYDVFGQLVQEIVDAEGLALITRYAYDANGNVTQAIDAGGTATCHTYDTLNRRTTTVEDCGGTDSSADAGLRLTTTFTYDLAGRLLRQTDARGVATVYAYDDLGREVLRRYDDGGLDVENRTIYAANGDLLSIVDGRGVATVYTYDPLGRRLSETVDPSGLNLTTTYAYDGLGRLIAATDPEGDTTTHTVNAFGETVTTTDPLGNITHSRYDDAGNLIATIDPTGVTLRYTYDGLYRLVAVTNPLGDSLRYIYDGRGNRTAAIDANGNDTTYTYDARQLLITETDALGNTTAYEYDGMGRLIREIEPLGTTTTYAYDGLGRLIEETNPLGESTIHAYDGAGNRVRTVTAIPPEGSEADGQTTQFIYDGLGRLVNEIDPLGNTVRYEYDANGNRTAAIDPRDNRTRFTYDGANRLITITDPLDQTTTYTYDGKGQISRVTHANGDVIDHTYDAAGRETNVAYSDGSRIERTYDAAGRVTAVTDPATDVALHYDALGRLATVIDNRLQKMVGYTYDAAGNRTSLVAPDGLTVQYAYDRGNRLTQVRQGTQTFRFDYDANRRLVSQLAGPDGSTRVQIQLDHDDAGRPVQIRYQGLGTLLDQVSYTYDAAGNRTGAVFQNGDAITYAYDDSNRLVSEIRTGALGYSQTFEYDAAGNRTRQIIDGAVTTYQYNSVNQLIQENGSQSTFYTYDARNRLIASSDATGRTFGYNTHGEMTTATGPEGTVTYTYDAFRRRVSESVNGVTTDFLHDGVGIGTTILAEYSGNGLLQTGYTLAPFMDSRLARTAGGAVHYYLPDGLGSTRYLMHEAGGLLNRYEYDAFGRSVERAESVTNPYQFAGRRWDEAAALYDNRARRYNPNLGRFVQADPLGQIESTNLYQYARNNPVTRIDPLGWSSKDCLSINRKSDDLLGLKKYTDRLDALMSGLPNRPKVKASGTLSVQGKVCSQCCKDDSGGDCPDCPRRDYVGSVTVAANADLGITWPLAAVGLEIRGYGVKLGVEAYGKLNMGIAGAGEMNLCKGETTVKLCGSGSVSGGVKGGLLQWPFEAVKLEAYIYGQLSGTCRTCIAYSLTRGVSILESRCQACAEAGYKVEVKFLYDWITYSRQDIFAKGCIG